MTTSCRLIVFSSKVSAASCVHARAREGERASQRARADAAAGEKTSGDFDSVWLVPARRQQSMTTSQSPAARGELAAAFPARLLTCPVSPARGQSRPPPLRCEFTQVSERMGVWWACPGGVLAPRMRCAWSESTVMRTQRAGRYDAALTPTSSARSRRGLIKSQLCHFLCAATQLLQRP